MRRNWSSLAVAAVLTDWRAVSPIRAGRMGLSSRPPRGDTRDPSRETTEEWRYTYRESGERRERERERERGALGKGEVQTNSPSWRRHQSLEWRGSLRMEGSPGEMLGGVRWRRGVPEKRWGNKILT